MPARWRMSCCSRSGVTTVRRRTVEDEAMGWTIRRLVIGALLLLPLTGCALTTAHLDLEYRPEPGTRSPLSAIKPMTIALAVEDQRPPGERNRVGDKRNNLGMVTARVETNREPTRVLYDALKAELERNGHKILEANAVGPAVAIHARLLRYWGDGSIRAFDVEMTGTIRAEVSVLEPQSRRVLFARPVTGTARDSRLMGTDGAFEDVLNRALAEFVRGFARDPGLLEALRAGR